jgi:Putative Ice-binding-like adhesive domain
MKLQFRSKRNQGTALLLTCLAAALIIASGLASYLTMVEGENATVARSQAWNNSMVIAEAGIEEGMALVNQCAGTGASLSSWSSTAVSADGWTQNGGTYTLTRNLGAGHYTVTVNNVNAFTVTIESTGTVPASFFFGGTAGVNVSRTVLVNAATTSSFQGALLTKKGITLSGNALVDSFNSHDPNYSTNGRYDSSKREAHGNIMSDASNIVVTTDITMSGNGHVYGHAYLGPNDAIKYSGNVTIGDTNWSSGIEPGWTNTTANIYIPDAPPIPSVSWLPMPTKTNNTYVLNGGGPGQTNYYQIPSNFGNLSGQEEIFVTNGTVVLDVEGNFSMSGQSELDVEPNASMVAWFNGNPSLSGNGVVNDGGNVTNVTLYGTPNSTSMTISGNGGFTGTVYAPYANVTYSGNADFIGSIVGNSFTQSGNGNIHYDESLQGQTSGAYVVSSWQEVRL